MEDKTQTKPNRYTHSDAFCRIAEPSAVSSPFVKALLDVGICPPECTKLTIVIEVNKPIRVYTETFLQSAKANTDEMIVAVNSLSDRLRPTLIPAYAYATAEGAD